MIQKNFLGVWAGEGNSEEEFKDEFLYINQKSFHTWHIAITLTTEVFIGSFHY